MDRSVYKRFTARESCIAYGLFAVLIALVFAPMSVDYAFYYSDAPRYALNGAFILDLVRDHPFSDPVRWAFDYYTQYPALTILFYPPLYPAVLAIAYALLGVSQLSAVVVDALFLFLLAAGTMHLARRYVEAPAAIAAGALAAVAPEIVFWARQIMTDVPATALAVWASVLLLRYLESDRAGWLVAAVVAMVSALWIKFTLCFVAPVVAFVLILAEGRRVWRRPRNWWVALLAVLGVLPLLWLTFKFGQTNVANAAGAADAAATRGSLANWLWYARAVVGQLGWPLALAGLAGLIVMPFLRYENRLVAPKKILLLAWIGVGYLFFSAISLKSSRFSIPILPPLIVLAVIAVSQIGRVAVAKSRAIAIGLLGLLVVATLAITLWSRPPLQVQGYGRIAREVARIAPKDSNVVFSGYRDGAFIFAMRAIGARPDLNIVRADKLLLKVAIRRENGVGQYDLSKAQIAHRLDALKVRYVVAQNGFWSDLVEMRRFESVLKSDQFVAVQQYHLKSNFPAPDRVITIYRNRDPLPTKRPNISIDLPAIHRHVSGQ